MEMSILLVEIPCPIYNKNKTCFFHSCTTLVVHCHPTTEQPVPDIFFMPPAANEFEANIPGFDSQDHDLAHYTLTAHSVDMIKDL